MRILAVEKEATELAGRRMTLHCQATAVCGLVSSWRNWPTGPAARSIVGASGQVFVVPMRIVLLPVSAT